MARWTVIAHRCPCEMSTTRDRLRWFRVLTKAPDRIHVAQGPRGFARWKVTHVGRALARRFAPVRRHQFLGCDDAPDAARGHPHRVLDGRASAVSDKQAPLPQARIPL